MLAVRLLRLRTTLLLQRGIFHQAGLVAVDNTGSIASLFRCGACLVGLTADSTTAMNFIAYHGAAMGQGPARDKCIRVALNDLGRQEALFADHHVALALGRRSSDARELTFSPTRVASCR
jgi:hypothetical protein